MANKETQAERLARIRSSYNFGADLTNINSQDEWDNLLMFNPASYANDFAEDQNYIWYDSVYNHYLNEGENELARIQSAYDRWYNSEEQKSLRLKASGQNPDIQGIEGASTTESEMAPQLPSSRGQEFRSIMDMGSNIFQNLASVGLQIADTVNCFQVSDLQKQGQSISNYNNLFNGAVQQLGYSLSPDDFTDPNKIISAVHLPESPDHYTSRREARINQARNQIYDNIVGSPYFKSLVTGQGKDAVENAVGFQAADTFYQGGFNAQFMTDLYRLSKECDYSVAEWQRKRAQNGLSYENAFLPVTQANSENAQNAYNAAYFNTADGSKAGQAFNESNQFAIDSKENDQMRQAWVKKFSELIDKRVNKFEAKGKERLAAAYAIFGMYLRSTIESGRSPFPSLPSMNFVSKINNSTNYRTSYDRHVY